MNRLNNITKEVGYIDVKENPATIITICDYILTNGLQSDWKNVQETFSHLTIGENKITPTLQTGDFSANSLEYLIGEVALYVTTICKTFNDSVKLNTYLDLIHKVENLKAYILKG